MTNPSPWPGNHHYGYTHSDYTLTEQSLSDYYIIHFCTIGSGSDIMDKKLVKSLLKKLSNYLNYPGYTFR